MRFVLGLVAVLSCGCFSKPGFSGRGDAAAGDDANRDGAVDALSLCTGTWSAWSTPVPQVSLAGMVTGEPTITADLLTVYWAHQDRSGPEHWEILWAHRSNVSAPFTPKGRVPFDTTGADTDQDPSVTSDGKLVVFKTGGNGTASLLQAEYDGTSWQTGEVPGLQGTIVSSHDITGDGLTLYFNVNTTLHVATRQDRAAPFVPNEASTFGESLLFPSVFGDQRTLYYPNSGVSYATRATTTDMFEAKGMLFPTAGKDPDVTEDGSTMVLELGGSIAIAQRTCL